MRLDRYDQGGYAGGGITENGGNISGPLVLAGNPSQTLEAVPKQYVDAYFNSLNASNLTAGTLAAARLPAFTGDLQSTAGTSQLSLVNSGVVAGEHGKVTVNSKGIITGGGNITNDDIPFGLPWNKINPASLPSTLSGYGITNGINLSGGTLTGFLSVTNQPTLGSHVATKQYVDALVSGGGIAVGDILRKPYSNTPAGFLKCNGAEVSKTTYADLYAKIGDQYQENTMSGSGKPWQFQYDINATQSGDIVGWTADTGLPYYLAYSNTIVTKNRVYVIGGHTNTVPTNAVYYATLNADGTLGTWTAGTALPAATFHNEVIVIKNRVYVFGGNNASNTATLATVYSAVINADGTLGNWVTETNLPYAVRAMSAFATKTRIYLIGGVNGSTHLNTVIYANINSDGSLGAWAYANNLPWTYSQGQIAVIKNKVYIVGGAFNTSSTLSNIYSATIDSDGAIGSWNFVGNMPGALAIAQIVVSKNTLYVMGGHNGSAYVGTVYYCSINQDGTLGTWSTGTSLALATGNATVAVGQNRIYMIAGFNGGYLSNVYSAPVIGGLNDYSSYYSTDNTNYILPGAGQPWIQQYEINNIQSSATVTGWVSNTNLPEVLSYHRTFVTKNRVYIVGIVNGNSIYTSAIFTAPINADGTLGAWVLGSSLPGPCSKCSVAVIKNRVYIFGGLISNAGAVTNTVYTAPINADGTLGTWTSGISLPSGRFASGVLVTKNKVYLIGGSTSNTTTTNSVISASIGSNGLLGQWVIEVNLPISLGNMGCCVIKNYVYLIGGSTSSDATNSIYRASFNTDGTLSSWALSSMTLPENFSNTQVFTTNNRVYLLGGNNVSNGVIKIYSCIINSDGTLGEWVNSGSMPAVIFNSQIFVTNNFIYSCGGHNSSLTALVSSVYSAPILGGLNDYSAYYNGTIFPADPALSGDKFTLPDLTADELFGSYSYIKY